MDRVTLVPGASRSECTFCPAATQALVAATQNSQTAQDTIGTLRSQNTLMQKVLIETQQQIQSAILNATTKMQPLHDTIADYDAQLNGARTSMLVGGVGTVLWGCARISYFAGSRVGRIGPAFGTAVVVCSLAGMAYHLFWPQRRAVL